MAADEFIAARVSSETKEKLRNLAAREGRSETAVLRALLETMLRTAGAPDGEPAGGARGVRGSRLSIRLEPEDRILLADRAAARKMASATYVSVLVRSHLRELPPLPRDELTAMKRAIAELGAVRRALQQIAVAADKGARITGPDRDGFAAFLKIAESLRDHTKALLNANTTAWEKGYADAKR